MEEGYLQLKLISCRDLQAFNFFQKLSVYAVVSIYSDNDEQNKKHQQQCLPRQKTLADEEGGGNPEWNHIMQFDLKSISGADHLFLNFKLLCAGLIFGKRCIGEVCVPFKDLIDEFNGTVKFLSYQIRRSNGKPNGVLNFSYKVKGQSENKGDHDLASTTTTTNMNHFIPEKQKAKVLSPEKTSLYPSLDEIRSPLPVTRAPSPEFSYTMPAFTVSRGVYYNPCPCPSPMLQSPGPYWYPAETAAGYGYGLRG